MKTPPPSSSPLEGEGREGGERGFKKNV